MKRRYEEGSSYVKSTEKGSQEGEGHMREDSPIRPGPSMVIKAENQQENENSSIYYSFSSSFSSSAITPKTDCKGCIYYIQVKTIKGVAVAWETETGMEPIQRAPRIYELNPSEENRLESPYQNLSGKALADMEKNVDEMNEDYKEEEVPGPSRISDERRRRKIPDWMVTTDNGYRCVACCRVFLTLEDLKRHAKSGPKEGFSCHVFNKKIHERRRVQKNLPLGKDEHLTQSPKEQSKPREDQGKGKGRHGRTSRETQSMELHHDKDAE
ncbi:protein FAM170A [Sarcophilus harrisii]|uniref:Family with sequence similarity 170 member A n=1 Tax=Sarcophilus harrisii TaxID=9305 RepID=A0A7N4NP56_SARHA|nr:protein FAM170A [Sarcophilus harrisii]XP_031806760.1 protein FAM170A [Sarcophilus harrisii]XP_031806761.1 protein FAM170A [Sarcophilus harrisii]